MVCRSARLPPSAHEYELNAAGPAPAHLWQGALDNVAVRIPAVDPGPWIQAGEHLGLGPGLQ